MIMRRGSVIPAPDPWSLWIQAQQKAEAVSENVVLRDRDLGSVSDCHLFVLRYEHNTSRAHSLFTDHLSFQPGARAQARERGGGRAHGPQACRIPHISSGRQA